jgi:ATP-dependent DNA helicase RecG
MSQLNEVANQVWQHLFYQNQATIDELVEVTGINEKTIRLYLNQFKEDQQILTRLSDKQRHKDAKHTFKKI